MAQRYVGTRERKIFWLPGTRGRNFIIPAATSTFNDFKKAKLNLILEEIKRKKNCFLMMFAAREAMRLGKLH